MPTKKAQGAIEFIIIFGSLLFFFIVFFAAIQSNTERKNAEKEGLILQNIALSVKEEINLAAGSSEGYYREFKTPENILGKDYEITIVGSFIYTSMDNLGFAYKISDVNGSIQKGTNIIRKENGTVYLN